MHHARWRQLVVLLAVALAPAGHAAAVEPVDEFLAALRQKKWYDEALIYLDRLPAQQHVVESVRQRVLYERGLTLLESAAQQRDPPARETLLTSAGDLFTEFVKTYPEHAAAGLAKIQLVNISLERARGALAAARETPGDSAALSAARTQLQETAKQFDAAETEFAAQLAALPKLVPAGDEATRARKQQLAGNLAQVRLARPTIDYELATSYDAAQPEAKKYLTAAAERYRSLYETYRTRAAGQLAHLWEGRCYQRLGAMPQALACFRDLADLPEAAETRSIRTQGTRHALECLTSDDQRKYQEAIERGQKWDEQSGAAADDPDALAIRYLTAVAYQAQSRALPDKDPNRRKLAGVARQIVSPVAEHPGEYQRPAKMLLVALAGAKDTAKDSAKDKPAASPKDAKDSTGEGDNAFATQFDRARAALEQLQTTDNELKQLGAQGDVAVRDALTKKKAASAVAARRALRAALATSDPKTSPEDLSTARYYLCFLEWDSGHLYDAAVLGEFLARRYPDSVAGKQGARIALAAYIKLYADSKRADKSFEVAHIDRLGQETFQRWPGSEEADEAALQLLSFAANRNDWDRALEYLKQVSPNSPRRGQAELRAGQALWSAYLRRARLPQEERPPQAELDALKKQAQQVLSEGVARMEKSGMVDATLGAAVFALAQICIDTGQPDEAIRWLEHEKLGPLSLIKAKHPVAEREGFAVESNKLALRAYIAVRPQQLEKAEAAMDALEKLVGGAGDAQAAESLTAIYVSLGRELQQQLQDLRKSGQTSQLAEVSKAFEVFLDRVVARGSGNSYTSLNWVAETYYSLGGGHDEGQTKTTAAAAGYFLRASEAYERMLALAEKDPKLAGDPDRQLAIRLRLAECYRRAGKFDAAIRVLADVLKQKPMLLPAQVEAASTYQAQGALDSKSYALAILGGAPGKDGKNTIWGWARLSKMTATNDKFAGTFHEARLNMAQARYQYALAQEDARKRKEILDAAKQDLWFTYKLRPDLGGEEIRPRYDRLLKQIQTALGDEPTGLTEFSQRDAAGTTTAASTDK
ncbi:MAG: tetratricopeptide repeat protein [Pirellulales bacterium]